MMFDVNNLYILRSSLTTPNSFIVFEFNVKSFATAFLDYFFLTFFPSRLFFWTDFQKISHKKAYDQDLTHSLDTLKSISVKTVPQVVIRDPCGT